MNHPTAPFTSYGVSKTAGEEYLMLSDFNVISFRLATVCGPRFAIGPIPTFYKRLKNNQKCFCTESIREFMDIKDFFNLIEIVLNKNTPKGIFNASPGKGYSIRSILRNSKLFKLF